VEDVSASATRGPANGRAGDSLRRLLFLSYYFPPIGGAGAQRPARFVRYLPEFGYEPVVVTGPGKTEGRWTPHDDALAADVPPGTVVHRLSEAEPPESSGWRGRGERWLGLRSPWSRWWVDGAVALGHAHQVDVVYAWMSPFESAEAAGRLARDLGKPWVADLGDPWALDEMIIYPTGLHRRRAVTRMRKGLASAAAIVMSTPEAVARVREHFPEWSDKPVLAIPNGFDRSDFAGPPPGPRTDSFRIVHTGYLHTELGERQRRAARVRRLVGGAEQGVDILTRSHLYLLQAIDSLVAETPALESKIEVHLAGVLSPADREVGVRSPIVHMPGYLPHSKTVELLRSADLLFLPMHDLPPGRRAGIVPGKTYEYLASGKPILAAVPDGDARDLLTEAGNAYICRPADVQAMKESIRSEIGRLDRGLAPATPSPDVIARYEYRRLTRRLAELIDELAGSDRNHASVLRERAEPTLAR
jgi:glycosyltransferase involved in cell wall biosynthesis